MRELVRRLVSSPVQDATLLDANLRNVLTQLVGADGFAALLRRALALAATELPALQGATVGTDGQLHGNEHIVSQPGTARDEAAVAIAENLVELLVTLIGEPLTQRLVRQACPESLPDE